MFIDRLRLIEIIEEIRKNRICAYLGYTCDCKFGAKHINSSTFEDNGCPELMYVAGLLYRMTDEEYNNLCIRKDSTL